MNKQNKKNRAVSAEGEGPATAETTDPLLVLFLAVCYESGKPPQYEAQNPNREVKNLPPANPAISEPVFLTLFNSMEDLSILAIPNSLSLFLLYIIINSKKR